VRVDEIYSIVKVPVVGKVHELVHNDNVAATQRSQLIDKVQDIRQDVFTWPVPQIILLHVKEDDIRMMTADSIDQFPCDVWWV